MMLNRDITSTCTCSSANVFSLLLFEIAIDDLSPFRDNVSATIAVHKIWMLGRGETEIRERDRDRERKQKLLTSASSEEFWFKWLAQEKTRRGKQSRILTSSRSLPGVAAAVSYSCDLPNIGLGQSHYLAPSLSSLHVLDARLVLLNHADTAKFMTTTLVLSFGGLSASVRCPRLGFLDEGRARLE